MEGIIKLSYQTKVFFWESLAIEALDNGGVVAIVTRMMNLHFNSVIHTDLEVKNLKAKIDQITKFYKQYNVPWSWTVTPIVHPKGLDTLLEKNGFVFIEAFPTMLYTFNDTSFDKHLKKFDIRVVKKLDDWIIPVKEGFKSTDEESVQYCKLHKKVSAKEFQHFVAYIGNNPVAAATLSISNAGARIDDIATRPQFQRQGFGTAITLYALKIAKQLGYKWCCLDASEAGISLYENMGFKKVCDNKIYALKSY